MVRLEVRSLVVGIAAALGVAPWSGGCDGTITASPAQTVDPAGRTCDPTLPLVVAWDDPEAHDGWMCMPDPGNGCHVGSEGYDLYMAWTGESLDCFEAEYDILCGPIDGAVLGVAAAGDCCFVAEETGPSCVVGRPLVVDGAVRRPDVDATDDVVTAHWLAQAADEHASVAAFARVTLQLLALGAPADLVAAHSRAQHDEVRHAEACRGLARRRGATAAPAVWAEALAPIDPDVEALLIDTVIGGCVGETLAAARADAEARAATDPAVREVLEGIAADEARHAALAWRTARWLLSQRPDLVDVARHAFVMPTVPDDLPHLPDEGLLGAVAIRAVHGAVWARVVAPARDTLLATDAAVRA